MSLNASMALKDGTGNLLALLDAVPDGFNGGTPMLADRRLAVTAATTGLTRVAGLAYDSLGRLAVGSAGPVACWVAGVPVDGFGRVWTGSGAIVAYAQNGIPITSTGAVALLGGGAVTVGDPSDLFKKGEQGIWLDPSDLSTLSQDAAGTIPVTGPGQPVRKIRDKSGNANHGTLTGTPTLQQEGALYYLDLGTNDSLDTAPINFTTTDKLTVWVGLRKAVAAIRNWV